MRTLMISIFLTTAMALCSMTEAVALQDVAEIDDLFGFSTATGDFNKDGFADLAVGVRHEEVAGFVQAGAVHVLYGSSTGLSVTGSQFWNEESAGIADDPGENDHFGHSVAAGYFDKDEYADLAVGVPGELVGIKGGAGAVHVLYGSPTGLSFARSQFWHVEIPDIEGDVLTSGFFGAALAAGDFGNGPQDDLAIGAYGDTVDGKPQAGAVHVLYGSSTGLTAAGNQYWHQNSPNIMGEAESADFFGVSLAAANFGRSPQADLAVGVWSEDVEATEGAGVVHVLYGSSAGLTATDSQFWYQDSPGVPDDPALFDHFGWSLTAADFGNGLEADLAIGVPNEDVSSIQDAGAVQVLYGSSAGLSTTNNQLWHQDSPGVAGNAEIGAQFGFAMAAAKFDKNSQAFLAVGVPFKNLNVTTQVDSGEVAVIYGSPTGLRFNGNQLWLQDSPDIEDATETNDFYGFSLAAGNFGRSSQADLAVGVPNEDLGAIQDAGAVNVIYGSPNGLSETDDQFWHQDIP